MRDERGNTAISRNQRLTAIRTVLAYALPDHPEHADHIRQVLALRPSKVTRPDLSYLDAAETDALLCAPDTTTWVGRRDQALLTLAITAGLRISEITSLTTVSIHLGASPYLECDGKGRKHRATPISPTACTVISDYLVERTHRPGDALFPGPRGQALSRDAIEARIRVHVTTAAEQCPSLRSKHVTCHTLRHTCAMNLLHSGVDITVIALWLGHEQTTTTDVYLHHDMESKKSAMERTRQPAVQPGTYAPAPDVLTWLDAL